MVSAIRQERAVIHSLETSLGLNGVREDDELVINVFQDRPRKIKLKRTIYSLRPAARFEYASLESQINLPVFDNQSCDFELQLIPHFAARGFSDKSRYLIRSLGPVPFKLNGTFCFEAFLERGDRVEIGLNCLHFKRAVAIENDSEVSQLLLPEVIQSSLNIVIEGETGTGKTTLAKKIHEQSQRSGPFVHLNLSAFSQNLIESELFGHVKGAFTGALNEKKGALLEAHRGTLFLDEIDSIGNDLQTKLLLFLDDQEVRPVGATFSRRADVRLIFASGRSLKNLVDRELMRRDFYFRISSGSVVELKSLREQPEKIRHFCLNYENENNVSISQEVIAFYEEQSWPGNLRQLKGHLDKKKILSNGKKFNLEKEDYDLLEDISSQTHFNLEGVKTLDQIKRDYCLSVYQRMNKNLKRSAQVLDISPNTMKVLIRKR
jgi:transcriptional regulator of acetoin/glycerol metabolism